MIVSLLGEVFHLVFQIGDYFSIGQCIVHFVHDTKARNVGICEINVNQEIQILAVFCHVFLAKAM